MQQSDHDKIAERIREEEREKLINLYIEIASKQSEEYGFLNVRGHEVPDPTVIEPPLGYVPAPDLMEQMRRMVRNELSKIAEAQEFETFEEADDFDIDDDPVDYTSPYEEFFDPAPGDPAGPAGIPRPDPNAPKEGEIIPPPAKPSEKATEGGAGGT